MCDSRRLAGALCLSGVLEEHRDRKREEAEAEAAPDHHVGGPADLRQVGLEARTKMAAPIPIITVRRTRSPSTRALIEHSASVIGTPASTIGQSTTAQCLRISRALDPATLAASRVDEENRLAGVLFQLFR